jgi:hypothetical protein
VHIDFLIALYLLETMNWGAHAIEMDLSMLKPHAVVYTRKQIFITGLFFRGLSWTEMDE